MKILTILVILLVLTISVTPAFALQQQSAKLIFDMKLGESQTQTWKLVSDSDDDTFIKMTVMSPGRTLVSFPSELVIPPRESVLVEITVNIPDDHQDNVILTPRVIATQEAASESAATKINIAMATRLTINIGDDPVPFVPEPIKDTPEIIKDTPEIIKEKVDVPKKQFEIKEGQSQGFTIKGNDIEMIPEPTAEPTAEPTSEPQPECGPGTEAVNGYCKLIKTTEPNGGGCLIATAAYGTELAPQVQFLREIRDNTVMSTESGISFMTGFNQLYYSFSPTIADMERENPMFQEAVRAFITPMVSTLSIMTLADSGSEAEVLGLGISVIMLNLGMYIAAPLGTIIVIGRKITKK